MLLGDGTAIIVRKDIEDMIVTWNKHDGKFVICFKPEEHDSVDKLRTSSGVLYGMNQFSCYFSVPRDWSVEKTHPDLLATLVLLIVEPYAGKRIKLPKGVSKVLQEKFKENFGKDLIPVDKTLKERHAKANSKPALAFSGGVDSMAAKLLMPKETIGLFVDRDSEGQDRPGLYNKSAALHAIKVMRERGHNIYAVRTDYEFVRQPVGFAWAISSAAPALLLADYYNLDSVAFGMILESAYHIGDHAFEDPGHTYTDILATAGLPANLVTAGLSEVATTRIVMNHPDYYKLAQSCIRGKPEKPCNQCMKCFRKLLLEKSIQKGRIEDLNLRDKTSKLEVYNQVVKSPLHHENVYAYALSGYKGKDSFVVRFRNKVRANKVDVSWMNRWYKPSEKYIFEKYRKKISSKMTEAVAPMSRDDQVNLMQWNPSMLAKSRGIRGFTYRRNAKRFTKHLPNPRTKR